jgi:protein SCO1/2
MTKQLTRLQWQMEDPAFDQVQILSHTVDPQHDTPEVLKEYAEKNGARLDNWSFLTGKKEAIYEQGMKGYLLSTQEDEAAPGGFLHSGNFVLLDKDRHIRGFYDGTSTKEVDDLMDDILMLLKEEEVG